MSLAFSDCPLPPIHAAPGAHRNGAHGEHRPGRSASTGSDTTAYGHCNPDEYRNSDVHADTHRDCNNYTILYRYNYGNGYPEYDRIAYCYANRHRYGDAGSFRPKFCAN